MAGGGSRRPGAAATGAPKVAVPQAAAPKTATPRSAAYGVTTAPPVAVLPIAPSMLVAKPTPARTSARLASPAETDLVQAVRFLQSGDWQAAERQLEGLTRREPKFHLAQFILADLLAARSGNSEVLQMIRAQNPRAEELIEEYRVRMQDTLTQAPPSGAVPDAVLSLSGGSRSAIVVDLSRARLYVMQKSGNSIRMVGSFYASIARNGFGKNTSGDLRTPVGIYHANTFTPGTALPPFYGSGAFPLDYPNLWDRALGRTGSGIWLHGVPGDTYVRPPRTSEGCVVLANSDLLALRPWIGGTEATPVVFSDRLSWSSPDSLATQRRELSRRIELWRSRWAAGDTNHYLSLYAPDFRDNGMNRMQLATTARSTLSDGLRATAKLSNIDLFRYPGEKDLVMAEFDLDYPDAGVATRTHHQQFWRKGPDGQWKIIREDGAPELRAVAVRN
jgi:murein L,D-transpeptidase YafK